MDRVTCFLSVCLRSKHISVCETVWMENLNDLVFILRSFHFYNGSTSSHYYSVGDLNIHTPCSNDSDVLILSQPESDTCWWIFCCGKDMRNTCSSLWIPLCMHNQIYKQILVFVNFRRTRVLLLGEALQQELITVNWEGNKLIFGVLSGRIVYKGGPSGLKWNHLLLQNEAEKQPKLSRKINNKCSNIFYFILFFLFIMTFPCQASELNLLNLLKSAAES